MECLIQIAFDALAIEPNGFEHVLGGRARWREQRFDEAAGVLRIQTDDFMASDNPFSRFPRVSNHECRHRAAFERGGFLKDALVLARDPGDEPLRFLLDGFDWHGSYVRLRGTHCKD